MGNAAAKLEETKLGLGSLQKDEGRSIAKAFVSTQDGTTKIKNKGKTWVTTDDTQTLLWKTTSVGKIRSHSVVEDSTGTQVAIIITAKKGMASCTNFICRSVPAYEGQSPLTDEELYKAAITSKKSAGSVADSAKIVLYPFAKIETSRKLTTAKCTYGIFTSKDDVHVLYEGEKLSSLSFKAIFKEITTTDEDGTTIAKASMPGMSMSPHVDAAIGVDLLAIVSMGYALAGDESSAGALAGAGAV